MSSKWFEMKRDCGGNVRELLHDGHSTVGVGGAAFGLWKLAMTYDRVKKGQVRISPLLAAINRSLMRYYRH